MTEFKEKMDEIISDMEDARKVQSKGNLFVEREPGFIAVSLSKVVEIYSENLCIVCLDANEFELEFLDTVFSPTPRDEYLRNIISDMINDVSDGSNELFETVKEVMGENVSKVKREDYKVWSDSYLKELQTMLLPSISELDLDNTVTEVVIMKNVESLVFVIFVDDDSNVIALLENNYDIIEEDQTETLEDDEEYDEMDDPLGMPDYEDEDSPI